ncbi:MAG: NAD(P)H-hydrate dehydratase [Bacteroidota bacterium]
MGTAGAGDVLTGAIAGLLAQGLSPLAAAGLGVVVHGLAGDLAAEQFGPEGVTASRIMAHLGPAIHEIRQGKQPLFPHI